MRGQYGKYRPKLTPQDILFIVVALRMKLYGKPAYSKAAIARYMGVTVKTIYNIEQKYLGGVNA